MARNEYKFILNIAQYEYLRARFNMLFTPDSHDRGQFRGYPIMSAYYDTSDLKFFYQKINGEFYHTKIRLRIYGPSLLEPGKGFIEAKLKSNDLQNKIRIAIPYRRKLLDPKSWYYIEDKQMDELLSYCQDLYHVCNVYYERLAYEWKSPSNVRVRLNFDSNILALPKNQLCVVNDSLSHQRVIAEDQVILEVKVDGVELPDLIKRELKAADVSLERFSKYAESLIRINDSFDTYEIVL